MALRKRSTVRRKKVSRASKRPRTTGSGKHPAASQKGERCRAHHNAKIADIRARHIPRRSARGRIPFGDGGTSVNSLRRHRAPKRFVSIADAGHNDLGTRAAAAAKEFIAEQ